MKTFTIEIILLPSILPLSYTVNVPYIQAQTEETSTISIMTLASMTNNVVQNQTIENRTANYYNNVTGYLAYPTSNQNIEKLPAVVMIHENRGLNDYIKESANILAQQGYVVLAVDFSKVKLQQTKTGQEN